jgi:hypothetical protein
MLYRSLENWSAPAFRSRQRRSYAIPAESRDWSNGLPPVRARGFSARYAATFCGAAASFAGAVSCVFGGFGFRTGAAGRKKLLT